MNDWAGKPSTAAVAAVGLAGSAAYLWAKTEPDGYRFNPSLLHMQSLPHPTIPACRVSMYPEKELENETHITVYDSFLTTVKKHGGKKFLGKRSSMKTGFDIWITYSEALERMNNIGYGMRLFDLQPSNHTLIGMFSKNRSEMLLTQYACYQHSMVLVPMYDTLGEEGIQHIINQTEMQLVVCDTEGKVKQLLKWGCERLPSVAIIVHMVPVSQETISSVHSQGWTIISFSEMEFKGKANPVKQVPCKPEDLCLICYTSGTTGKPKGAMIEHNALYRTASISIRSSTKQLGEGFLGDEHYLSYLPMAHMYEQIMLVEMILVGASIGMYSGEVTELLNDIRYIAPTYFASVPRLLTKIYDTVMNAVNQNSIKRWLFNRAMTEKEQYYRRGIVTKSTVWDKMVFKKLQDMLGGRIKVMITGAAPISPPVLRFLRLAFGAMVCEGYGQTESSAGISLTMAGEYKSAEVGPPLPFNMIKLVDVPEMGYTATENGGEVCLKGLNVFKGYFRDEEKTRETIDIDGWLHTGDIGAWTDRGTLKIIDRKKNIFKLAQGEYIAPEKIENVYVNCPLVAQCYVHGDSLQPCLVAVVVPDAEVLPAFARTTLGLNTVDMKELCRDGKVKVAVMEEMAKAASQFNLKGFEEVKDIHLTDEPFSVESGLLTPTLKLKRVVSRKKYERVFDEMYTKLRKPAFIPQANL